MEKILLSQWDGMEFTTCRDNNNNNNNNVM